MLRDWPEIQKYVHLFIPLKTQGPILLFTFFTSSRPLLGKLTNLKSTHRTVLLSLFNIFFSTTLHSSYFLFREWTHKTHIQSIFYLTVWWLRGCSVCLQCGRPGFAPRVGKIPWRRKWQPTPVFLPGESHGQRSLVGYSPWGCKKSNMTKRLHFPFCDSRGGLMVIIWGR